MVGNVPFPVQGNDAQLLARNRIDLDRLTCSEHRDSGRDDKESSYCQKLCMGLRGGAA